MFVGVDSFCEVIRWVFEIYYVFKKVIMEKYGRNVVNVGDEGGFVLLMKEVIELFDVFIKVIEEVGYKLGDEIVFVFDVVFSEFFDGEKGKYVVVGKEYDKGEFFEFYCEFVMIYLIVFIEDLFYEEDWEGFVMIIKEFGSKV